MSNARGIFLAGTDTDVGKTIVSAALVLALAHQGLDVGYVKSVASGCEPLDGRLASPDSLLVARLAELAEHPADLSPLNLAPALSPLAAARQEGLSPDMDQVMASLAQALDRHAFTVVEGVGGVMVPVAPGWLSLDMMERLGLPVVLAARPGLGTINHTLLSIQAVRQRGLEVLGFIFSGPNPALPPDPAEAQNPGLITEFSGVPHLGTLPWLEPQADGGISAHQLRDLALTHLDLRGLAS